MPILYPASLDSFSNPGAATLEDAAGFFHDEQHANANDAVEVLQAKLGISETVPVDAPAANTVLLSLSTGRSKWAKLTAAQIGAGETVAKLDDRLLGASASAVSFAAVPQTYRSLRLEWQAIGDVGAVTGVLMRLTADGAASPVFDGAANYDYIYLQGSGTAAAAATVISTTGMLVGAIQSDQTGFGVIEIPNYSGGTYFHWAAVRYGHRTGTTATTMFTTNASEQWKNAGPVRGLTIFPAGGNFTTNSRFTLWGLP